MNQATVTQPAQTSAPNTTAPVVDQVQTTDQTSVAAVSLLDKVNQFKSKATPTPTTAPDSQSFFDYKEIEKITDPVARKFAEDAYKSMQSGFTKKTQEIAEQKRQFDSKLVEMQSWTPERIQRELSNPAFLQAAQQYQAIQNPPNSGLTDEQFSALTTQEKAEISALKTKINSLEQSNFQSQVMQRDTQLQTKYPDYNPSQIDSVIRDLANMSPLDIREHVYKSLKHDEDVAAAYELGRQESQNLNQNRINAITPNGNMTTTSNGMPIRDPKDTDREWFAKVADFRLAQFKNRKVS